MNAPPQPWRPLPMRVSRRELDAWQPGAAWDLSRYLPWLKAQRDQRGASAILLVLTAEHCGGCEALKEQLEADAASLAQTLVVLAEGGDLRGNCFFGVRLGAVEVHAPGVPTGLLLKGEGDRLRLEAVSLGPFEVGPSSRSLVALLGGSSYVCRDAQGARLRVVDPSGEAFVAAAGFTSIPLDGSSDR